MEGNDLIGLVHEEAELSLDPGLAWSAPGHASQLDHVHTTGLFRPESQTHVLINSLTFAEDPLPIGFLWKYNKNTDV